jgi:hypothetical protein
VLAFTYSVGAGENSLDLDYASAASLSLNGATVKDSGGANPDADLTLPAPGAALSLGANKNIVIDTVAPTNSATAIGFSNDTGSSSTDLLTKTAAQTISGALSQALAAGESVKVSLDNGATWYAATSATGSTTYSLSGQTLAGSGTVVVKVSDAAGNDGSTFSRAYVLDTAAPAVTVSGIAISADTGSSSSDFVTNQAGQTISATLSAAAAGTDVVFGSLGYDRHVERRHAGERRQHDQVQGRRRGRERRRRRQPGLYPGYIGARGRRGRRIAVQRHRHVGQRLHHRHRRANHQRHAVGQPGGRRNGVRLARQRQHLDRGEHQRHQLVVKWPDPVRQRHPQGQGQRPGRQ